MVGTSPNEIRQTYEHWIPAAMQRLDDVQRQAWLASGLDRTAIRVKKWGSKPAVGSQLKKLTQLGNLHARLKPGARVDVIVEADSNATLKKP
jgi:hypothetical protein